MLQGALCIALRGADGFETWKPQHAKKWLEAHDQGKELPDPKLDLFIELFDKLFAGYSEIDRGLIEWLNETRNGLIHFNTDSYSIERASVVSAIREALKATRKTLDLREETFFYEKNTIERFHSLCDAIDAQLVQHAAA